MAKLSKEEATNNYNRRFNKWQELDNQYKKIVKRYVWLVPIADGQPVPNPEIPTVEAVEEWDRVATELHRAKSELDEAFKQLIEAYHSWQQQTEVQGR